MNNIQEVKSKNSFILMGVLLVLFILFGTVTVANAGGGGGSGVAPSGSNSNSNAPTPASFSWMKSGTIINVSLLNANLNYLYNNVNNSMIGTNLSFGTSSLAAYFGERSANKRIICTKGSVVTSMSVSGKWFGGFLSRYLITRVQLICTPIIVSTSSSTSTTSSLPILPASTVTWNSPSTWVQTGGVISAQKLRENLDYLYSRVYAAVLLGKSISLGNASPTATFGKGAQTSGQVLCPQGSVMTGVNFKLLYYGGPVRSSIVRGIQPICKPIMIGSSTISSYSPSVSTTWINPISWVNNGSAISAQKLKTSFSYLKGIAQATLLSGKSISIGNASPTVSYGSWSNVNRRVSCPLGSAITGMNLSGGWEGGFWHVWILSKIQPICRPIKIGSATIQ